MSTLTEGFNARQMREILERFFVYGVKPCAREMHELGYDITYLEKIIDKVGQQLWMLQDHRPLKEVFDNEKQPRILTAASNANIRCLYLADKRDSFDKKGWRYVPLVGLSPINDGSSCAWKGLHLFVTCGGEWIHYHGSDLADNNSYTICRSVEELSAYLGEMEGDSHRLAPHPRDSVLITIANWLVNIRKAEVVKLKRELELHEATVAECKMVQKLMNPE